MNTDTLSNDNKNPILRIGAVSSSGFNLTENRFIEFMSEFGNASETYDNGKKVIVYTLNSQIDNKFNLSYHLKFPQKNVQFNFWFDKLCYLNSRESVTISFFNGNEPKEKDRLKSILTTTNLNQFKSKADEIFTHYR